LNNWPTVKVSDVCELIVDCVNRTAPLASEPTPFKMIRTTNVSDGFIDTDNVRYVDEETYRRWTRRAVPLPGDVVLTREAPLGRVGIIRNPESVFLGQRTIMYRSDPGKLDPFFLMYSMLGDYMQGQIRSYGSGSTVEHVRLPDCFNLILRLPPFEIQRKIAAVLSAYDDLIENNTRRIQILEEMAQAIYREWFVEFRYPGHGGVPLVDSELGPVPEGWSVRTLRDVSTRVLDGDWIETKDQGGRDYRLLQVSNVGLGSFRETGKYRYVSEETFLRLGCTEITLGSILVSRMPDPVGRAWYVDHLDQPAITAVDVAIVQPDQAAIDPRYCAFYLNSPRNLEYAAQRASGTTRLRITRRDLETFPILVPPSDVRAAFGAVLEDVGQLSLELNLANRNLRATRDLLLPRLISGEVDVSELDIDLGESAA
jgi:type I restriction enzyme S subunit